MSYFIGIDTGTQGVRIGISDIKGNIIAFAEEKWDTTYPNIGWAEQSPLVWWNAIINNLKKCLLQLDHQQRDSIVSCCVCATSSTVIPIDKSGSPLMNAIMWMDARAKKEMQYINDTKHEVLQYCGGEVSFEWLVPKLLWIKNNRPEIYHESYKVIEQLDWINYKLTKNLKSSICNTTCKWNYVESLGGYKSDFFEKIGLSDYQDKMIMEVIKIGDEVGKITPDLARELNINPEMIVVQGAIDAHMAMFGMNVLQPNKLGIIMGTSFVHLSLTDKKVDINGIWGPYENAVVDNFWLLEAGQISASGLVNWFRKNFHIEALDGNPYKVMFESLDDTPLGAEGVVVLDFFQGNRTPYKDADAKGVIYGLNTKHTWKHIYRAVVESIAYGTHNIISNYERQNCYIDTIVACGGVVQDKRWMQIIADVTGKEIIINENLQAGVLGGCVVAAGAGRAYPSYFESSAAMIRAKEIIRPCNERHIEYQKYFKQYIMLYENLKYMMSSQRETEEKI